MTRRIIYITGTRADFGLMRSALLRLDADSELELGLIVTGMHLDPQYGDTIREVESSGLTIVDRIFVELRSDCGSTMARAIGTEIIGMVACLAQWRPDVVLLLGDRGEMLAGAIAALHLNILIAHIHGGERSGTVDEPVRHAISKLSHYHFTATQGARERLVRMGEHEEHVFVTGAPGLDGLSGVQVPARSTLAQAYGFDSSRRIALVIFHPVVQEADMAAEQMAALLKGVSLVRDLQALVLMPNADAGGEAIRAVLANPPSGIHVVNHLSRDVFCHWLAVADVMVGNSSSGVIEAASFSTPVVNVGGRQQGRERSANLVDTPIDALAIRDAINNALATGRVAVENLYGDGLAGERIAALMKRLPLTHDLLLKCNAY